MSASSILGPAVGYILGGSLLNIYVDYPKSPPSGLTPNDPRWVGAWWLGFLISSIFSALLALVMFLFPKELPGTAAIRAAKVSEAHQNSNEDVVNGKGFGLTFRDMPRAAWYLLRNPTYMCITIVATCEIALAAGFSTFMPKYVSNQFGQKASAAGILTGYVAVPGAALGQFTGGFICRRMQLKVLSMLKMTIICSILVLVLTPIYWAQCPETSIAGVTTAYPGHVLPEEADLNSTCNSECGCSTSTYEPVCADGIQYFSPCHAGCSMEPVETSDDMSLVYHNCVCPTNNLPGESVANLTLVTAGLCPQGCQMLYAFLPLAFVVFFITFLMGAPTTMTTLRVVPESQRAFAISFQWVFLRFFGSIPGPIIFGSMIDASCSLWDEECSVRGSCWVYNNFDMSLRLFILSVVLKVLALFFNILGSSYINPLIVKTTL
ncbi:SLCO4C1 [Bugula neritina]|uniref:Solute carrier organic anion transporter family member n=1 Tax=Bugula neritina TaxID=10212 RepID=A0A7J7KSE5_BUGNE|nr:SLCO4C1 [Bugula neritina]